MTARFLVADVFDGLATLEDGTVDLVVTSPPFLGLRSYLPADHPDKSKEIGSESIPAEFLDVLLRVTAELRRVLAPHGSICVELGDTYAGSGGAGGDYGPGGWREGQETWSQHRPGAIPESKRTKNPPDGWPLAKSKTLIPELYRIAIAYGINPLTGQESPAGRWRVRNNVTWCRPNPPVGALGDKWRPATSDIVVACTSDKRYWDDIATRREISEASKARAAYDFKVTATMAANPNHGDVGREGLPINSPMNSHGAPLLDWWEIPPGGYPGSHYAVFPPALVEPLIKAMAPPKVCQTCGEPSRRIVKQQNHSDDRLALAAHIKAQREARGITRADFVPHFPHYKNGESVMAQVSNWELAKNVPSATDWPILVDLLDLSDEFAYLIEGTRQWTESLIEYDANGKRLGKNERRTDYGRGGNPEEWGDSRIKATRHVPDSWSDCGHDDYRPALVLDPFAGSGTTLSVATGHGHDAIGIDLDPRNRDLAYDRIGPLMWEEVS